MLQARRTTRVAVILARNVEENFCFVLYVGVLKIRSCKKQNSETIINNPIRSDGEKAHTNKQINCLAYNFVQIRCATKI